MGRLIAQLEICCRYTLNGDKLVTEWRIYQTADGLTGVAYEDDDQVVELVVRKHKVKRKEEERVEIEIREAV